MTLVSRRPLHRKFLFRIYVLLLIMIKQQLEKLYLIEKLTWQLTVKCFEHDTNEVTVLPI